VTNAEAFSKLPADQVSTKQKWLAIAALVIGALLCWKWFGEAPGVFYSLGPFGLGAMIGLVACATIVSLVPPIRRLPMTFPWPRISNFAAFSIVTILSAAYLIATAIFQHRPLQPIVHDEFSYQIGAQMLAHGQLWHTAHPLRRFFDSFQLIVDPVYASAYFPGTAMLLAPAVWLSVPFWAMSLFESSMAAGMLFVLVRRMISAPWAFLAVLMLLSTQMFRTLSVMSMSQIPSLLAGLAMMLCWLNWQDARKRRWLFLLGLAAGFGAITRPLDALCYAIPIGLAMLWQVRSKRLITFSTIILGAAPFLATQLVSNKGITGHWFTTPFRLYADRDHPNTSFGFHAEAPAAKPVSDLPQKQDLYSREYAPLIQQHTVKQELSAWWDIKLRSTLVFGSPAPFPALLILLPAGVVLARFRSLVLLATIDIFVGLYFCYVFFLPHYTIVVAPAIIVGILIGTARLPLILPLRFRSFASCWLVCMVVGISIFALPQWDKESNDEMFDAPLLTKVDQTLDQLAEPSVVLFTYDPKRNVHEEPVYNVTTAWPDDAKVIRAHDRGTDNLALFNYYAKSQPSRKIYEFNEATGELKSLGSAGELSTIR